MIQTSTSVQNFKRIIKEGINILSEKEIKNVKK